MKKNITPLRLALLVAIMPLSLLGQQKSVKSAVLKLDPAVRTGKLPNGFTYFIRHNEEPKNRVLLYLVNNVGSMLEDEDQRGLAHFMEHMSFNGTRHFPHNELVDYLQKAGIRFGADLNAHTGFNETVYELPIPSDKPELLKGGLEIMRDWVQEALLDPTEIDKERGVVLEEKRLHKGADERMQEQYWPMLVNHSRYAVRIAIGVDTVLDNFKRPVIARFYQDWYRPDLQALIIAGDIDVNAMEQTVKKQFASLKNPAHERPRTKYIVPLTGKNQFMALTDKELTAATAEIWIKHPAQPMKTLTDYRKGIIQNLFNQMLGERYSELSRQSDPPFVQGSAGISGFIGGLNTYDVSVNARPGELEKGLKAVWRETARVKRFGFTATELERAKAAYLNGMETALQEKNKTNSESYVNEYQEYFLNGTAAPGIAAEYALTKQDLPTINLSDLNKLAATYITDTNRDILIMAPDKDKITLPDEATVGSWLRSVEAENLQPYKDEVSRLPLLTAQPVPGHITNEITEKKLNIYALTLSNGAKVFLKPTNFKNDEIVFYAFAPGGTSLYSDADFQSAANAAGLIAANGVGNYTPDQLAKYLEGKQVHVAPYIGESYEGISGVSTAKDLKTAMQLIYAKFTEPRKDTAVFKGIIEKSTASLLNRDNDPGSVFSDTVDAVLGNYNIRRTGPTVAKVRQIDLDKSYKIYKERFADASNFTFTFAGSIDTTTINPLLEKYIGSLPATYAHETAKDLNIHVPYGRLEKTVYKGSEPQSTVILVYSGKFDYSTENKVLLDALKETLEIRLLQRLREEESGVYTPSVYQETSKYPQSRYGFVIQFGCAPQNVEKLIASANDEIAKLRTNGPLQENLDKWRAENKSTWETQLRTNGFWLSYITGTLQNKEDWERVNEYPLLWDKTTTEQLKTAAQKYLAGDNYIRLVLLPETGIASK